MKFIHFLLVTFLIVLLTAGCSSTSTTAQLISRAPVDVPEAFVPKEGVVLDESSCKSPLVDPRDGTTIMMIRSHNTYGDYLGPDGRYGLRRKELLRVNCGTGEVIGIVKR